MRAESWINGEPYAGDGRSEPVTDPGSGEIVGHVARGSSADVDAAVAAATRAGLDDSWRSIDPHVRGRLMWDLSRRIEANHDRLAELLSRENGKPLRTAGDEIGVVARYFEFYAGWADKLGGRIAPVPGGAFSYVLREPLGVVAHIIPWNYPVDIFARGVAPCLAVGNTVVVKPDHRTPLATMEIVRMATEVGFPDGVINVVNGTGDEAGAAVANHPGIDALAFCGSQLSGRSVLHAAADQTVPVVSLELGGKSALIVMADADAEKAASAAAGGICYNGGQSCGARSRLLVHESMAEEMAERVTVVMSGITVGYGLDNPDMGSLISDEQLQSVMRFIESARAEGATLREGGTKAAGAVVNSA